MNASIWNHFEKIPDTTEAICMFCKKPYSYKTSITNLKRHLYCKHLKVYEKYFKYDSKGNRNPSPVRKRQLPGTREKEEESDDESGDDDTYWNYFERESGGRGRCNVCRTVVSYKKEQLRSHLQKHHPKLLNELGEDVDPVDDDQSQDEAFTEVIYIEEPQSKPEKQKRTSMLKRHRSRSPSPAPMRKRYRSPSPAPISKRHRSPQATPRKKQSDTQTKSSDEEIETFGNYLVCLLKRLPRDVSMGLQRDIINLVMSAQLSQPSTSTTSNPQYIVISKLTDKSTEINTSEAVTLSSNGEISVANITIDNKDFGEKSVTEENL